MLDFFYASNNKIWLIQVIFFFAKLKKSKILSKSINEKKLYK